jgi:type II secretory pathway pseudopilin PulG
LNTEWKRALLASPDAASCLTASCLINTPLQRGEQTPEIARNRFNGFFGAKTVKTVMDTRGTINTSLKRGVNERHPAFRHSHLCSSASICGFSLIEILVTIGLLSFIVLGLLAMFNQTQRAFMSSMKQTDVLEAGRATMDMITRELAQTTPCLFPDVIQNGLRVRATNFFAEISPGFPPNNPLLQELPGNSFPRVNAVQRFFFVTKVNQDWIGTGYQVIPEDANGCVGSLYRFYSTNLYRSGPFMVASADFLFAAQNATLNSASGTAITNVTLDLNLPVHRTNYIARIADGVVHLRVRAFAKNGCLIVTNANPGVLFGTNGVFAILPPPLTGPRYTNVWDTNLYGSLLDPAQSYAYFMNEAVPAYVEVELGILEPQVLRKYRSIPIAAVQRQYLSNHVAAVHIFRQRVPIANVNFAAYP